MANYDTRVFKRKQCHKTNMLFCTDRRFTCWLRALRVDSRKPKIYCCIFDYFSLLRRRSNSRNQSSQKTRTDYRSCLDNAIDAGGPMTQGYGRPATMNAIDYRKTSYIRRTLVGNKTVDHSDVVGASPVGAAPTTSSFSTKHLALLDWTKGNCKTSRETFKFGDLVRLILEILR